MAPRRRSVGRRVAVPWSPATIPATCVACERLAPDRTAWRRTYAARRREGPRHDHLRRRELRSGPSGSPAGIVKPAGIEELVGLVEAVVDDPDLDPVCLPSRAPAPRAVARRSAARCGRGSPCTSRRRRRPERPAGPGAARPSAAAARLRTRWPPAGSANALSPPALRGRADAGRPSARRRGARGLRGCDRLRAAVRRASRQPRSWGPRLLRHAPGRRR